LLYDTLVTDSTGTDTLVAVGDTIAVTTSDGSSLQTVNTWFTVPFEELEVETVYDTNYADNTAKITTTTKHTTMTSFFDLRTGSEILP
jgi:hypothetical protein